MYHAVKIYSQQREAQSQQRDNISVSHVSMRSYSFTNILLPHKQGKTKALRLQHLERTFQGQHFGPAQSSLSRHLCPNSRFASNFRLSTTAELHPITNYSTTTLNSATHNHLQCTLNTIACSTPHFGQCNSTEYNCTPATYEPLTAPVAQQMLGTSMAIRSTISLV